MKERCREVGDRRRGEKGIKEHVSGGWQNGGGEVRMMDE